MLLQSVILLSIKFNVFSSNRDNMYVITVSDFIINKIQCFFFHSLLTKENIEFYLFVHVFC